MGATGASHRIIRSSCSLCFAMCGVLIHVEDGKVVKVEGDPDSPVSKGALCSRAALSLDRLYHPDRLTHPLKRVGGRGEGKWARISWDEALDTIAGRFIDAREKHGPESLFIHLGSGKHQDWFVIRLANAFGIPNTSYYGHICWEPRRLGAEYTCGFHPIPDYEYPPACLVVWGCNMEETRANDANSTRDVIAKGAKLVVIDPREIRYARQAHMWLRPRPGSDLALALGMINVVVNEGLFDKDFVENWTVGFDQLRSHVQGYSPETVAGITWVPAETIREAARLYATTRPAAIQWGNAFDHSINSFQACRAITILRAITGNLCVPGGELKWRPVAVMQRLDPSVTLVNVMPPEVRAKRIWHEAGRKPVIPFTLPQLLVKAILQEDPYHIAAGYVHGANLLLTHPNAQEMYRALMKVDFFAVAEHFMTPTAALADIVLPAATYLEYDFVHTSLYYPIACAQQKAAQIGECRPDHMIMNELAKRLGIGHHFWKDEKEALDAIMAPAGLTFDEFRKMGVLPGIKEYRQHTTQGFPTPSGKVELYSKRLQDMGHDPLPVYYELPETPQSDPDLAKQYPFVLTSWKPECFRHSGDRNIGALRRMHPEPLVEIHEDAARELGIGEGDQVYLETRRGRIKQRATIVTGNDPRVVIADYGWWFPERGVSELYGWKESNINVLTDDRPPYSHEIGSYDLRGMLCRVCKVEA